MAPKTYGELFQFYTDVVKPLYSSVQLTNKLPVEVLFEINAAFDHLSRRWTNGEDEAEVVGKAFAHLKRSCLDIFKLAVKKAVNQFEELRKVEISLIDNGSFEQELRKLFHAIQEGALTARTKEGASLADDEAAVAAFDLWAPVYSLCVQLESEFYFSDKVLWAKRVTADRHRHQKTIDLVSSFILGVVTGVIGNVVFQYFFAKH